MVSRDQTLIQIRKVLTANTGINAKSLSELAKILKIADSPNCEITMIVKIGDKEVYRNEKDSAQVEITARI